MAYDPTAQTQVPAKAVRTGTYLHRPDHPTVNIGTKVFKNHRVTLGLVSPPAKPKPNAKKAGYTMQYETYDPETLLTVSRLP